ncbi:hypothetical protein HDU97_008172 [Phlyctochytrium planicorne]|nr:hypothetical protein HDU97_008172 [Phlyctochytrium planicorne]
MLEVIGNKMNSMFHISQILTWQTIGYLLIFRSKSFPVFTTTLFVNVLCNIVLRLLAAYIFYRSRQRDKLVKVDVEDTAFPEAEPTKIVAVVAASIERRSDIEAKEESVSPPAPTIITIGSSPKPGGALVSATKRIFTEEKTYIENADNDEKIKEVAPVAATFMEDSKRRDSFEFSSNISREFISSTPAFRSAKKLPGLEESRASFFKPRTSVPMMLKVTAKPILKKKLRMSQSVLRQIILNKTKLKMCRNSKTAITGPKY